MTDNASEYQSFVVKHTRPDSPTLVPDIQLHLVEELAPLCDATKTELDELLKPPPFWVLAWSDGQALARYVLDHPELVQRSTSRISRPAAGSRRLLRPGLARRVSPRRTLIRCPPPPSLSTPI